MFKLSVQGYNSAWRGEPLSNQILKVGFFLNLSQAEFITKYEFTNSSQSISRFQPLWPFMGVPIHEAPREISYNMISVASVPRPRLLVAVTETCPPVGLRIQALHHTLAKDRTLCPQYGEREGTDVSLSSEALLKTSDM